MTDADIIQKFEAEIENDPAAYERPGECVYQITAKELVRAARAIERQTLERAAQRAEAKAMDCHTLGNAEEFRELSACIRALIDAQSGEEKK
jgi:hypothetical protein